LHLAANGIQSGLAAHLYNPRNFQIHIKEEIMQSTSTIQPSNPPKDPMIAAILSLLLFGGAGHLYLGQQKKGIILIVLALIGICTGGILTAAVHLVGAYDAYVIGNKLKAGQAVGEMEFFWQAGSPTA